MNIPPEEVKEVLLKELIGKNRKIFFYR